MAKFEQWLMLVQKRREGNVLLPTILKCLDLVIKSWIFTNNYKVNIGRPGVLTNSQKSLDHCLRSLAHFSIASGVLSQHSFPDGGF